MFQYRKTRLLLAGVAFAAMSSSAFALDGEKLFEHLSKSYEGQGGMTLKAQDVSTNGSNVTLSGVSIGVPGEDKEIPLGKVELSDVEETGDGGYTIGKATFDNVDFSDAGSAFKARDIVVSDITVPAEIKPNPTSLSDMLLYRNIHVGPISAEDKGTKVFAMDGLDMNLGVDGDNSTLTFDYTGSGVFIDMSSVKDMDPKTREKMQALDLMQISGTFSGNGNWNSSSGMLDMQSMAYDFDKVGKLDIGLSISGYTLEFVRALQEATKAAQASGNTPEAQQASGMAMLGLMQQLSFVGATIRFEDHSITERALDVAGKDQGMSGEQMAQMLKAMVPIGMAQLQIPELQNMVSQAVNTYLDNPENITVSAKPADAVPFPMIMGAAMGAPKTLPQVLGVTVTAND
ncbi:hypothetical protein [Rhizobium sp. PAMB 3182]